MASEPLPSDVTIRTICAGLLEPVPYVRGVLQNLWSAGPDARMRISVCSGAGAPDYLVDKVMLEKDQAKEGARAAAYSGKTHRLITANKAINEGDWSTSSMGRSEVAELLGNLRNFKPKGAAKPGQSDKGARRSAGRKN